MKNPERHTIAHQAYTITMLHPDRAHEVQSGISLLQETDIQPLLQEVMDLFSDSSCIYRFDKIEIDLGSVNINNYQKEITLKIEEQLSQFFKEAISSNGHLREGQKIIIQNQKLQRLKHFLQYGYFDWSASGQQSARQLLTDLLEEHSAGLVALLQVLGKKKTIRNRLVYQFGDEILNSLVSAVAVEESDYILSYKSQMFEQQRSQVVIDTGFDHYRDIIWHIILSYIFIASNGYYNRKNFLNYLIKNTAQAYNLSYDALLNAMFKGLHHNKLSSGTSEFKKIIAELQEANLAGKREQTDTVKTKISSNTTIKALQAYLNRNFYLSEFTAQTQKELLSGIRELLINGDEALLNYLKTVLVSSKKTDRLTQLFDLELLNLMLKKLPSGSFKNGNLFFTELYQVASQLATREKQLFEKIHEHKSFFLCYAYEGSRPLNTLLISLITKVFNEIRPLENDYLMILTKGLKALPLSHAKIVKEFIKTKKVFITNEEIDGNSDLQQFAKQLEEFIRNNEPETWYYWLTRKLAEWTLENENYKAIDILDYLLVYNKDTLKNADLTKILLSIAGKNIPVKDDSFLVNLVMGRIKKITLKNKFFKEWSIELTDVFNELSLKLNQPVNSILDTFLKAIKHRGEYAGLYSYLAVYQNLSGSEPSLKTTSLDDKKLGYANLDFIFRNHRLPWWNGAYSWNDFNTDFKKYGKEYLSGGTIYKNFQFFSKPNPVITKLSRENLFLFWNITDTSSQKTVSSFIEGVTQVLLQELLKKSLLKLSDYNELIKKLSVLNFRGTHKQVQKMLLDFFLKDVDATYLKVPALLDIISLVRKNSSVKSIHEFLSAIAFDLEKNLIARNTNLFRKVSSINPADYPELINSLRNTGFTANTKITPEEIKIVLAKKDFRVVMLEMLDNKQIIDFLNDKISVKVKNEIAYFNELIKGIQTLISIKEYKQLQHFWLDHLLLRFSYGTMDSWKKKDWEFLIKTVMEEAIGTQRLQGFFMNDKGDLLKRIFSAEQIKAYSRVLMAEEAENALATSQVLKAVEDKPYKKLGAKEPKEMVNPAFIMNSGLILLSPFLGMLFERCGFMEEGRFTEIKKQHQAVRLMDYLVWGEETGEENNMILNKVLAGIAITEPLNLNGEIAKEHKAIAESLLDAVRSQWKAMNGTSNEGLRTTFLQREGKLEEEEEQYFLKVAGGTFDMLLDQVPWNMNQIKLSWMRKILITEWR